MGKRRRPRPINRHAAPKAAGYWGLRHFALAPSLPCSTVIRRVRARFFSGRFGESRASEYQASVGDLRGAMVCRMRRIETDLEDFGIKKEESEKGDLGRGEREQSR